VAERARRQRWNSPASRSRRAALAAVPTGHKVCSKCCQCKPLTEFLVKRETDKPRNPCRACIYAANHDRYHSDPEYRERHKALRDRWRAENPTFLRENYLQNREQRIAAAIEYERRNPRDPERVRQLARERYAADPDRHRAKKRAWEDNNRELVRELRRRAMSRRRARLRGLPSERYTIDQLLERDGTLCVLCGGELDLSAAHPEPSSPTVEHLECIAWPGSAGDVLSNVAVSHWDCNNRRRTNPHPAAVLKRAELLAAESVTS
jgi:hypothetical protein